MYQKADSGMAISLYGDSKYEDEEIKIIRIGNYPYQMHVKFDIRVKGNEEKILNF